VGCPGSASGLEEFASHELVLRTGGVAMLTILIVLVIVLALGAAPAWPYSRGWGYYPSGTLGLVLLILIVLALTGRL
jgi:hypothetical protein